MDKKNIFVFEKDPDSLKFLKGFFRQKKDYKASIFTDSTSLNEEIAKHRKTLTALVIGSPACLEEFAPSNVDCPVIAVISKDITGGMGSVVRNNVEHYVLPPYHRDDFEYKLKAGCSRKNWFNNLYRDIKDLEAIVELAYLISSTLDPKEVLFFVVKKLSEFINVSRCSIISLGYGENRYAYVVSSHEDPEVKSIKLELQKYPEIRKALKMKKPVVVKNASRDPLMKPVMKIIKPLGIKSIVVIPMIYRDEVIGSLFLRTSRAGHTFTEREIRLCSSIAEAAVNPLYNAFLYERLEKEKTKLERLSITDYLTGSYNIRYLYHRLEDEFTRAQRYQNPLSCIMFDLDHFKKINDSHGHRVGDMVLREFAQLVRRHIRKSDVFARYGGEEFVMLLPHTPVKGALVEAERLKTLVRNHKFRAIDSKNGITVSMGISAYPDKKITSHDVLITIADNALYEAKNSGRDQIVLG